MKIVEWKRKQHPDFELVFEYETSEQYAVSAKSTENGFVFELRREALSAPVRKRFAETLFQHYLVKPSVYAVEEDGEPLAVMEIDREFWNKRLRITDLAVLPGHRRKGYGAALVAKAKEVAVREGFRAVFLDTHACNVGAIDFYRAQGFEFGGIDTTYYSNTDVERGEVWLVMAWLVRSDEAMGWRYGDQ